MEWANFHGEIFKEYVFTTMFDLQLTGDIEIDKVFLGGNANICEIILPQVSRSGYSASYPGRKT